ncbi:MAG: hypothetical protein JWM19_302 [Actinomycetia bacterium]|nr:hypothetical protein [Actinomycetes bacterium]
MLWLTVAKTRADGKRKTVIDATRPTRRSSSGHLAASRIFQANQAYLVGSGMPGRLGGARQRHGRDGYEQHDRARDDKASPPRESHGPPPGRLPLLACLPLLWPPPGSPFPADPFAADPFPGGPLPAGLALALPGRPRLSPRCRHHLPRRIPGFPFRNGPARRCSRSRNECRVDHAAVDGHQPKMIAAPLARRARFGCRIRRAKIRFHTLRLHMSWATISNSPRLATPLCYRRGHVRLPDQTLIRWYASSIV